MRYYILLYYYNDYERYFSKKKSKTS